MPSSSAKQSPIAGGSHGVELVVHLALLAGLVGVAVGLPVVGVVRLLARELSKHPEALEQWAVLGTSTLGPTVLYALLIGSIAALLGIPGGWALAKCNGRTAGFWLALVVNPILLPSYLPYAGWGLVRGPGTWLGDWLARSDPSFSVFAGHVAAVVGMVLWAWPIPALIISRQVVRLDAGTIDCTQIDVRNGLARLLMLLRLLRGSLVISVLVVGLVVLGSAIPLHVAQVPMYTIELWKAMQLSPEMLPTWVAATPLLLVSAAAGVAAGRWTGGVSQLTNQAPLSGDASRKVQAGTLLIWGLSVLVPMGLFLSSLGSWGSLITFWSVSGSGLVQSGKTGLVVSLLGIALCLSTWRLLGSGRAHGRLAAAVSTGIWVFAGMVPGVLVGQAVAGVFGGVRWIEPWVVPLTHLARFGWLPTAVGCALARQEPREEGWLKRLDGGGTWAWWQASVVGNIRALCGLAIAMVVLSVNEIESTVFVHPPGFDNLAQQLLDYLHYARDEQLSAAAANLLGIGLMATLAVGWLLAGISPKMQRLMRV